ncbi:MAG: 2-oxo acid dehydrogenase subunit E2 [Pseudomonadota bacterium]|nr:2-oxo acid dehydrogenase subunit E2 [Pseudomonadota bacterium]
MTIKEVAVPSLGGVDSSRVIEVLVKVGDQIEEDSPLITLESDKASMEIPSPFPGLVEALRIKEGDTIKEGDIILTMNVMQEALSQDTSSQVGSEIAPPVHSQQQTPVEDVALPLSNRNQTPAKNIYAGPFVRRMAFELDVDLSQVPATGSGHRVTIDDMKAYLNRHQSLESITADYSKWGEVTNQDMTRIQSLSAKHLMRVWQTVPQVTQHDMVDITELEALRKSITQPKVTMVAFVMKAVAMMMQQHDVYRRGWHDDKTYCIRHYYHIGFACETPEGLIVPVVKDVMSKDIATLAVEILGLSQKARAAKLDRDDLVGSVATVSSLGGIGGGHFTPIVNSPDAFILGVSRAQWMPVYQGDKVQKRYMMPISLSYDHRLIDGADGARFVVGFASLLKQFAEQDQESIVKYIG